MSYFKDGYYWRKQSPGWELDNYGDVPNGKGDLISNTMMRIMFDDDNSEWAYNALATCKHLLIFRVRWPKWMNQEMDAKNWIDWKWSQLWFKGGLFTDETVKYRPQGNMTRDPYTYFYACCVHLDKLDYIKSVTIPFHLYKTTVWVWRYHLITGKLRWLYNLLEKPDYALKLATMRRSIADKLNK